MMQISATEILLGCLAAIGLVSILLNTLHHVTSIVGGPPTQLSVNFRNAVDGISAIKTVYLKNCTVAGVPFAGSAVTTAIVATLTKIDPTKPAGFRFDTTDGAGTTCGMDPIFTLLKLNTGEWVRQTFTKIRYAARFVAVTNGSPGLTALHIWVNGSHVKTFELRDRQTQSFDLSAALERHDNTISFVGVGKIGASAAIALMDTPLQSTADAMKAIQAPALRMDSSRRVNLTWGPFEEEVEENTRLQAGSVSGQTLTINFNGSIDTVTASQVGLYTVEINGRVVQVSRASVEQTQTGIEVVLDLVPGTLRAGDIADIYWDHLLDAQGRTLWGHVAINPGP